MIWYLYRRYLPSSASLQNSQKVAVAAPSTPSESGEIEDANSNYKLTKEDFNQINKLACFTFQLGWNYERMQASGYLYMILPQLRKMYGDGTPELKEMMKVHTQFFNTFTILPYHYRWF